ncbi:acyl-CoA dehydrogenase family protein [Acidipila sp. EB88]|uniref:acyl-CoA dehydrogenase family protein n=1 Tax=Acidipila sp. EB88 TaxID=2305226 RepID=UPI000F602164|nr:acyl-CoA dehydrogenase family protein [Acidipila sp. EB88]RRA48188.1 acyl-CoA dehydrogenase [Acidipila sp. EB88]
MDLAEAPEEFSSPQLSELWRKARTIAQDVAAPVAHQVDEEQMWPVHTMTALAEAGLLGLHVPHRLGGLGLGLTGLIAVTEQLGQACSSSSMCFGMHSVGTAVIAAKSTPHHEEKYLGPIARGEHITTLALSESGSGVHFYLPETALSSHEAGYRIHGVKQWVTNAGHAHSYVVSCRNQEENDQQSGEFTCVVVDADNEGARVDQKWGGFGMRGNASSPVQFHDVCVPRRALLGSEGDQIWFVFEVVAPYFLTAMAGTYLGIAQAALQIAVERTQNRQYAPMQEYLSDAPVIQTRIAELWFRVEQARQMVYKAARMGDAGDPAALTYILSSKAIAGEAAVDICNEAMSICGGSGYGENGKLPRLLRDARASHVMAPTTNILKLWTGRAVLGLPIL